MFEQIVHIPNVLCQRADPRADRDRNSLLNGVNRTPFDLLPKPLGDGAGVGKTGFGKENPKLLSTDPSDTIHIATETPAGIGKRAQHLIANIVSVKVVDGFETVDIDHDKGERTPVTLRLSQRPLQGFHEVPAIV